MRTIRVDFYPRTTMFFIVIGAIVAALLVVAFIFDRFHRGAKFDGKRAEEDRNEGEADRQRWNLPVWRR